MLADPSDLQFLGASYWESICTVCQLFIRLHGLIVPLKILDNTLFSEAFRILQQFELIIFL